VTAWQAFILGLVEGLTEYLPVSSTGHLIVTQRLLGIEASEEANAFVIAIQAGAIVAVLGLYRQRVASVLRGFAGQDPVGKNMGIALIMAFLPAAVLGVLFDDAIEARLFGLEPVLVAWVVGALVMLAFHRKVHGGTLALEAMTPRMALIIGFAQCVAMWPGVSRSLATILGAVFIGMSLPAAVEFSFLLGVITLGAATAYKAVGSGEAMWVAYGPVPLLVGFVAAWASAVVAVKGMVAWLQRRGLTIFAIWRLLAAAGVGAWMLTG
jgi:undecaprenyl-diphosphatase